jgi:hypothetical protein
MLLLTTAAIVAQSPPHLGRTADELRDLAKQARKSGDFDGEANYLCQAARMDPNKYQKKCEKAQEDLKKVLLQFQADLDMGRAEMQHKDFSGAVRDLSKITFGPAKEQAQALMAQARIEGNLLPPDQVSQLALAAADTAYSRGDFDKAEDMLKRVQSPSMKAAANQLQTNINLYRAAMNQADALAQSGDFKGAADKYQVAAAIRPNGPGQPLEHARAALDAQAKADQVKAQQAAAQQAALQQAQASAAEESAQAKERQEKIKRFLRDAHREETGGDLKGALQAYESALMLDSQQADASAGKRRVLEQMKSTTQSIEATLTEGITDFYASKFDVAQEAIARYLQSGSGKHAGTAHFYLGASMLCQLFLADLKNVNNANLRRQAEDHFAEAKQLHYAPLSTAVSPKVLAVWTQLDRLK